MAGSSISLFPIMMVGMMGMRPLQAIFAYKPGDPVGGAGDEGEGPGNQVGGAG